MHDVNIEGFQLSPQQRHLWKIGQPWAIDSTPYRSRAVVSVRHDVDIEILQDVLHEMPHRHEILRTTLLAPAGMTTPLQVIHSEAPATPPATFALARMPSGDCSLTIDVPALHCDAGGLRGLIRDISRVYAARRRGTTVPYEGLQYADAAIWLNDTLDSPEAAAGRAFWQGQNLEGLLSSHLPFERRGQLTSPFTPQRIDINLAAAGVSLAERVARDADVSLETFLLTCWQCLIQRMLEGETVTVGLVDEGRGYSELENVVGLLARVLPLSGALPGELSFAEAMVRMNDRSREARQWAECFDWRSARDRVSSESFVPLVFEYQQAANGEAAGSSFALEAIETRIDRFTIKLSCFSAMHQLKTVSLEYDASVCQAEDITRLGRQFETLFSAAAEHPRRTIDDLRLTPPETEAEIIATLGRARSGPTLDLVHRLFEQQAADVPDWPAVVFEEVTLTYAELNARANRLAHCLRGCAVAPDSVVGLCVDRSVDLAVGILGILKAGAAYLPLDPHLPASRLSLMVDESRTAVVVSNTALNIQLAPGVRTVLIGDICGSEHWPDANPSTVNRPEHLAYVLFTSGSTGRPKGVAVEHRQLASYVNSVSDRLAVRRGAAFATVTTFAADLGNTSIFPALTSGGCLHVISEDRATDAAAFTEYLRHHPIDVLKIVPSHLRALMSGAQPADALPRERLVFGGELCPWELVDEVRRASPSTVVFNHYGPTETTVGATMYRVPDDGKRPASASVPIGAPLDHAHAYVLDRHQRIVPVWATGELHIGGAGVARGYLSDRELTNAKFVSDPWGPANSRMYRTGDRVRLLPGGLLEFIGRADSQVKIRGYRVELGEIEALLRRHPAVNNAAVLLHNSGADSKLAGFLIHRSTERPAAAELREFLSQHGLPDYMIPASFMALDALPLTANGKLDHGALHELLERPEPARDSEEPLTEWEARVAGIWQGLLGADEIRPSDNFYDLGGHSLMAIQVVSALERQAGVRVSPRDLVFHTLKQFAALCGAKSGDARASRVEG